MLLTAHCINRHVIWELGSLIFTLDFFYLSLKVLPFNLDMTILYRKLSFSLSFNLTVLNPTAEENS